MPCTICSGALSSSDIFAYAVYAIVFAAVTVAVPSMAAELVGGTVGLALAHAFEAAYTAQTIARIVNPITASLKKVHEGINTLAGGAARTPAEREQAAMQSLLKDSQKRLAAEAAKRPTVVLDPFTGKPDPHPEQPRTQALPQAPATTPIGSGSTPPNGNGNGKASA